MTTSIDILNVTSEQIDKARRIEHNGEIFYLVENSRGDVDEHGDLIEYKVSYFNGHLTCTCKAGREGFASCKNFCWHVRVAVAHAALYREERREQSQIETYVRQGIDRATAERVTYAQGPQFTEAEVALDAERFQARPFSILR